VLRVAAEQGKKADDPSTFYTPGHNCVGNKAALNDASDEKVRGYIEHWQQPSAEALTSVEDILPSMSAAVYARVGAKQLYWDRPGTGYSDEYGPRGWQVPP
jgi:hypothetical protein